MQRLSEPLTMRIEPRHAKKIAVLRQQTGLSTSQVVRLLLDNATTVRLPVANVEPENDSTRVFVCETENAGAVLDV
jgi:hypothetical protein